MTKAVLESGVLKEVDGHYELTGSIGSLSIPSTLQDSLMSRLDRLVTAKAVAQYASVIGRQFSYALLQAVSELDETMLQHELTRLVEAELVYQRGLPPHAIYIFKHALVQDIAYESLLRSTRQGYHRRIAEVLEKRFPETADSQPELLAHHYTEAGFNKPSVDYWHQAGQRASERSAHVEAIAYLTKGLQSLKTLSDTDERAVKELALQTLLGTVLRETRGLATAELEHIYSRQQILCQQLGDTEQRVSALWRWRTFYFTRAEFQRAVEVGEQLLALAQKTADPRTLLAAHNALGPPLLSLGQTTTAHAHLEQGISLYENDPNDFLSSDKGIGGVGTCLNWLCQTLWLLGYPDQASQRMQERLALGRGASSRFTETLGLVVFASRLSQCRREVYSTQEQVEVGLALSLERGFSQMAALATVMNGWVLAMQGQGEEGVEQIRQGLSARSAQAERAVEVHRTYHVSLLAEAYAQAGKVDEGLQALTEALMIKDKTGECWYEPEIHRLKGQLLLQQSSDNATEAESCFNQAISIAQNQSTKSWELRASTSLAKLWQSQGKREEARELLLPVYAWFTEGFDTADLIDAKTLLDELA